MSTRSSRAICRTAPAAGAIVLERERRGRLRPDDQAGALADGPARHLEIAPENGRCAAGIPLLALRHVPLHQADTNRGTRRGELSPSDAPAAPDSDRAAHRQWRSPPAPSAGAFDPGVTRPGTRRIRPTTPGRRSPRPPALTDRTRHRRSPAARSAALRSGCSRAAPRESRCRDTCGQAPSPPRPEVRRRAPAVRARGTGNG